MEWETQRDQGPADGQSTPPPRPARARRPALVVRRSPTGYVLHDPLLVRLAGLDAVPLPFTPLAPPATVLAHLRRLSPHRTVRFEHAPPPDLLPHPPSPRAAARAIPHPS